MKINNMREFGKAAHEGKEFETQTHGGGFKDFDWENLLGSELITAVTFGCIRTKRTTTYYRVLEDMNGDPLIEHSPSPFNLSDDSMFTVIHKFQLESED